ncbi:MAG: hypothetical protein ABWY93_35730 [Mycobacterium sp.]
MNSVLYFSPKGVVYETHAYTQADIAELVHDCGLECLTSTDRQFDFWFTPSLRKCHRRANLSATEMLMATTRFTARTVPLLRGSVVMATHDAKGALDGLSWKQLDLLAHRNATVTKRDTRVLSRRFAQDGRHLQPDVAPAQVPGAGQRRSTPR